MIAITCLPVILTGLLVQPVFSQECEPESVLVQQRSTDLCLTKPALSNARADRIAELSKRYKYMRGLSAHPRFEELPPNQLTRFSYENRLAACRKELIELVGLPAVEFIDKGLPCYGQATWDAYFFPHPAVNSKTAPSIQHPKQEERSFPGGKLRPSRAGDVDKLLNDEGLLTD